MKSLLVVTILIPGLPAHTDQAVFSTDADCQTARNLVLRNTAMTNTLLLLEQYQAKSPVTFEVTAECKPKAK